MFFHRLILASRSGLTKAVLYQWSTNDNIVFSSTAPVELDDLLCFHDFVLVYDSPFVLANCGVVFQKVGKKACYRSPVNLAQAGNCIVTLLYASTVLLVNVYNLIKVSIINVINDFSAFIWYHVLQVGYFSLKIRVVIGKNAVVSSDLVHSDVHN